MRFQNGKFVKKARRNHAPEFKAKVALVAARTRIPHFVRLI